MGIHINGDNNVVHNNVTTYNDVTSADDELRPLPGILFFWLAVVIIVGLMIRYWQISLIVFGAAAVAWAYWTERQDRASLENEARLRAAALSYRAEEQNTAYLQGDPRGLYGNFPPPKI